MFLQKLPFALPTAALDTQYTRRSKTGGPLGALAAPGERGSGVGLRNALRVLACPG